MAEAFIGLGTNIGDRQANLARALFLLEQADDTAVVRKSSVLETEPVDYLNQQRFLNQMVIISTSLDPFRLLDFLQSVEKRMGRVKKIEKGPRIIDLDIILYDDLVLKTERLAVPHQARLNRNFILYHLAELAPEKKDPETGLCFRNLLEQSSRQF